MFRRLMQIFGNRNENKSGQGTKITIAEVEAYFKQYNGHGFHMFREEPSRYKEYEKLNISPETQERWRQEIIRETFSKFFTNPELIWVRHSQIIEIMRSTHTNLEKNCRKLLKCMEQTMELDKKQKILMIEDMAGRTQGQKEGGSYLICARTALGEKMNSIMERLMDFACTEADNLDLMGWQDMDERFRQAVENYRTAYAKFGSGNDK